MRQLSLAAVAFALVVSGHAESAPAIPAGSYTLAIRHSTGPLTDAYAASNLPVVIASTGTVTIANAPGIACSMQDASLESGPTTITVAKGHLAGASVTVQLSIHVENGVAAGGILLYSVSEDGRTKSGTCTFTLAAR